MKPRLITIAAISAISSFAQGSPLTSQSVIHESRLMILNSAWAINPSGLAMDFAIEQTSKSEQRYASEEGPILPESKPIPKWMAFGVAKDVFWPLSLGIHFAAESVSFSRKHGAWLQYSFLQKPRIPSLALRVKYSQTQFNHSSRVGSSGLELASSYGIGPVSVLANLELRGSKVIDFLTTDATPQFLWSKHSTLGISVQPLFPTKFVFARAVSTGGRSSFISQLSLEM